MLWCNHCYKHAKNLNNEHHHQHGCYQNQIHLRYKLRIEKLDVLVHLKVVDLPHQDKAHFQVILPWCRYS